MAKCMNYVLIQCIGLLVSQNLTLIDMTQCTKSAQSLPLKPTDCNLFT